MMAWFPLDAHAGDGWRLMRGVVEDRPVCYLFLKPQTSYPAEQRNAALLVTARDARTDEVSIALGRPFAARTQVTVDVDGAIWRLFAQGDRAWTLSAAQDKSLVARMRKGYRLTMRATAEDFGVVTDIYDLRGFTKAFQKLHTGCK
jgi:hypothetical protein